MNLSGVNRLVNFRHTKSGSLLVDNPSPESLLKELRVRSEWVFRGKLEGEQGTDIADGMTPKRASGKKGAATGILHVSRPEKELGPVLRNMMRRANAEFLDRGLSVLYIAFGMLRWKDENDAAMSSPLLLVPVTLEPRGPNITPALTLGEDDTVMNPSLILRMRDFGIVIPDLSDIPDLTVEDMMTEVRRAIAGKPGWSVESTAVLSTFSFHKEAMYRDLMDNEKAVLAHPIVRALGTKDPAAQSRDFYFEPIGPSDIDWVAPPEDTPLVLDADSSQRAAVAAAVAGRSFVMDGPPGTGKSQTIANMMGALLHAGKTVLFVSEKAAALEVVRNRLADAGLENYLLELHSHKASRKEVAAALAHSLDNLTLPPQGMADLKRSTLIERRNQLNKYAAAMNEVREPLGSTLHDILGRLSELNSVPSAPLPETAPEDLDQTELQAVQQAARDLERSWRPARQGQSYLWRNVIDETNMDARLYEAQSALEALEGQLQPNQRVLEVFSLNRPSCTRKLIALLCLQHEERPALLPDWWITTPAWESIGAARDELAEALQKIADSERAVYESAGVSWQSLPPSTDSPNPHPITVDDPVSLETLTGAECTETAEKLERHLEAIRRSLGSARALASELGLELPDTFNDVDRALRLASFGYSEHRPLRGWLSRESLLAVREAVGDLQSKISDLAAAEEAASILFTSETLNSPVAEICERFKTQHRGLKKLSGQYRVDKRAVASWLQEGVQSKKGIENLALALDWANTFEAYEASVKLHADKLGSYWRDRQTKFGAVNAAIDVAESVLEAVEGKSLSHQLVQHLTTEPSSALRSVIDSVRRDLRNWTSSLRAAPALEGRPELALRPIGDSIEWLYAHIAPLHAAAARIAAVSAANGNVATTLEEAGRILALRDTAECAHADLAESAERMTEVFGDLYAAVETDLAAVDSAIAWTEQVRTLAGGPLTPEQATALASSRPVHRLDEAFDKWEAARSRILDAFDDDRQPELEHELDGYRSAAGFISELREDTIGQAEWFGYKTAREQLEKHGLAAAVDFAIDQRLPASQVPEVVERALLRSWADHILHQDRRLHPVLARDRAALVDEYRKLDRQLVECAACDIIRAANSRRPSVAEIGEPAVIRREGMKKSRHLPVRDLVSRTRNTCLAIKPCFMMSPLAVSQYLPPDMKFDVVIFDEASQVRPGDAINCVYRGNALILAGDDKQLPPTSFFERAEDDDALAGDDDSDIAEFQSILELAKGSGAFSNVRLKWHYRSRHLGLIEFSNYQFYKGRLITYPSARSQASDVGVEYFRTDGVYRRGGGADNPREAEKVAERVIHHFSTRPHLTLGVVTFSVSQADAIKDAIDRARESRRDLDRHFDESDRLASFFVKSLESVQGDERDVIIFSIGYGPDEAGKVTTNFGVLNRPKGWRRLNVAITRARQRVEVVASLGPGQIPPSKNENVEHLRAYLDYAERGQVTLALDTGSTGLGPDSPFEESVLRTIRGWGYTAEPQVGSAGYRIDIGLRHPAQPGIYALGIECDGYQYHSAPAARDRDRLREQVLTGLGWRLHRIWGTAWYRHRSDEENRLRAAIENAINAPEETRVYDGIPRSRTKVSTVSVEFDAVPPWTTEYVAAPLPPLPRWVDPSEDGSAHHMTKAIRNMATIEGPVHIDIVFARLRDAWGLGRIGHRIRANIEEAIRLSAPQVSWNDDFIDVADRVVDRVRTVGEQIRRVEYIHADEIQLAITLLLRESGATQRTELIRAVSRIFGWSKTSSEISQRVNDSISFLVDNGAVVEQDDDSIVLSN
ncbi:regulator [Mycobacterium sp. EPG1]|nr:regulator [Mycobacterium sp. EPG1]